MSNNERQTRYRERLKARGDQGGAVRVRVFLPPVRDDDDWLGEDRYFGAMPRTGDEIRIISAGVSYEVERVGHLEDGEHFVPAVWVRRQGANEPNPWDED